MPNLFQNFESISSKQWKQQLQFELNGADFNDTLVWHSPEDIKVKPFYHTDEILNHFPIQTQASNFKIGEDVFVFDVQKSIKKTNNVLNRGADEVRFTIQNPETDIELLLNSCNLQNKTIHFKLHFLNLDFINKIEKIAKKHQSFL
jgi:methylmalonyl-CoA mutase